MAEHWRKYAAQGHHVTMAVGIHGEVGSMTRLSCHKFWSNEIRLWLTIIAYDLGNL